MQYYITINKFQEFFGDETAKSDDKVTVFYEAGAPVTIEMLKIAGQTKASVEYRSFPKAFEFGYELGEASNNPVVIDREILKAYEESNIEPFISGKENINLLGKASRSPRKAVSNVKKAEPVAKPPAPKPDKSEKTVKDTKSKPNTDAKATQTAASGQQKSGKGVDLTVIIPKFLKAIDCKPADVGSKQPPNAFAIKVAKAISGSADDKELEDVLTKEYGDGAEFLLDQIKANEKVARTLAAEF